VIQSRYRSWVEFDQVLYIREQVDDFELCRTESKLHVVKAAKRGNDVYSHHVSERLLDLGQAALVYDLNEPIPLVDGGVTDTIFVSLTFNRSEGSRDELWSRVGRDFNRFISGLVSEFGLDARPIIFRVWEAQRDGTPHVHCLLKFSRPVFNVLEHFSMLKGVRTWRVLERSRIAACWGYRSFGRHKDGSVGARQFGFVDITAVGSLSQGVRYLSKYLTKTMNRENVWIRDHISNGDLTLALTWLHGKRSFSLSSGFARSLSEVSRSRLDRFDLSNSNAALIFSVDKFVSPLRRRFHLEAVGSMSEFYSLNPGVRRGKWSYLNSKIVFDWGRVVSDCSAHELRVVVDVRQHCSMHSFRSCHGRYDTCVLTEVRRVSYPEVEMWKVRDLVHDRDRARARRAV